MEAVDLIRRASQAETEALEHYLERAKRAVSNLAEELVAGLEVKVPDWKDVLDTGGAVSGVEVETYRDDYGPAIALGGRDRLGWSGQHRIFVKRPGRYRLTILAEWVGETEAAS